MRIKKHKTKFIAAFVILAVLTGAWLLGDSPVADNNIAIFDNAIDTPPVVLAATEQITQKDYFYEVYEIESESEQILTQKATEAEELYESSDEVIESAIVEEVLAEISLEQPYQLDVPMVPSESPIEFAIETPIISDITPTVENIPDNPIVYEPEPIEIETDEPTESEFEEEQPVNPDIREPIEPEDMVITDESFTVTLSVRVDTLLNNMHLLHREKHELVPPDGVIFPATQVTVYQGESVFNILQREMRRARIHMVSRFTPGFNSAYIEAINNIYEFDAGPLSGWMYSVNGWFPNFGASRYLLSPGDVIEWHYTVDLGRDLGTYWLRGHEDE